MNGVTCLSLQTMQPVSSLPSACVLCLGNFDGVHKAHRALMQSAKTLRAHRLDDAVCGVFCFDPPSSDFLTNSPEHLCTTEEKLERFFEMGMEYAFLADFEALRTLSPEEFVRDILQNECHCVAAVCGFNFRFGHRGAGDPARLKELLDAPVEIVEEIQADGERICSSHIRTLLKNGNPDRAAILLQNPYTLRAEILHGKELGRTWGFPTVNQKFQKNMLIPRHGVYVTDCILPNGEHKRGISNVGVHPTVDSDATVNCETHLLDYEGYLYGKTVTVRFLHFVRPEQKFHSAKELQEQIEKDLQIAKSYQ